MITQKLTKEVGCSNITLLFLLRECSNIVSPNRAALCGPVRHIWLVKSDN